MKYKFIFKNVWNVLIPISLAVFTFIVYFPTLVYGFVFDDLPTIINYIHIRALDFWGQFFGNPRWISRLLNQFTYVHWGKNPFAYRIFDIGLHILSGMMIFVFTLLLLTNLKKDNFSKNYAYLIATLTSGLFLLHPLQTQTVTYITQMRLEGLVVFFIIAVLLTFVSAVFAKNSVLKNFLYLSSFALSAFSAGTKEIVIVLPVLILLVDWFFIAQGEWEDFKSRIWIHVTYCVIVYGLFLKYGYLKPASVVGMASNPVHNNRGNMLTATPSEYITIWPYFISQFKILIHYIIIFFWPINLSFDYDIKLAPSVFSAEVMFPVFVLVLLFVYCLYRFKKDKSDIISFCTAWFFVSMLPRASIFPSTELVCDYKTYIASFGVMLFISWGIVKFLNFLSLCVPDYKRAYFFTVPSIFFILLGFATHVRNNVWSSEFLFWKDVIEKAPNKARAYNNYATVLAERGDLKDAIINYEKAIERDNFYGEPHVNLAMLYQHLGDVDKALAHYGRAFDIGEAHPEMFNNLGLLHSQTKNYVAAENCFKEAVALRPIFSRAYINLGNVYIATNKIKEAKDCCKKAACGDMDDQDTFYVHGILCLNVGELELAINSFLRVNPDYKDTSFNLAASYFSTKKYAQAEQLFAQLCKSDPKNSVYFYNYGLTLLNNKKYKEALEVFAHPVLANEAYPYVPLHYAKCLALSGNKKEAISVISTVVKKTKYRDIRCECASLLKEITSV